MCKESSGRFLSGSLVFFRLLFPSSCPAMGVKTAVEGQVGDKFRVDDAQVVRVAVEEATRSMQDFQGYMLQLTYLNDGQEIDQTRTWRTKIDNFTKAAEDVIDTCMDDQQNLYASSMAPSFGAFISVFKVTPSAETVSMAVCTYICMPTLKYLISTYT